MDVYKLFMFLTVLSILVSTAFDIVEYVERQDVFILISLVFLCLTSIIPCFFRKKDMYQQLPEENSTIPLWKQRNVYFVPSTMLVLVFKAMALSNAEDRTNMTISLWTYIVGSFTAHYMKESESKLIGWTFFILKPLVLTLAFFLSFSFHEHTTYEFWMKYLLLTCLGLYAYSELLISLFNIIVMQNCCPEWKFDIIKPLHLVTACISLSICAFFYKENIVPVVCVFVIIYLKHIL